MVVNTRQITAEQLAKDLLPLLREKFRPYDVTFDARPNRSSQFVDMFGSPKNPPDKEAGLVSIDLPDLETSKANGFDSINRINRAGNIAEVSSGNVKYWTKHTAVYISANGIVAYIDVRTVPMMLEKSEPPRVLGVPISKPHMEWTTRTSEKLVHGAVNEIAEKYDLVIDGHMGQITNPIMLVLRGFEDKVLKL